jgi:transposase
VHLILDSYATHETPAIHRWLLRHPRFHLHFTPTNASWLNRVERWFVELTRKQIKRGTHRSTKALREAITAHIDVSNDASKPFVWAKTADEILDSVARSCARTSDSRR